MPGIHFHATGDPHHHHHDHHDHDHHDHDHDHHDHGHGDHAHGFGDAASFGEPSALVRFLMSNYLAVMAVVVLVSLVLLLLRRRASRPRSRPDAGTDYGKEAQMNLAVRRARALEAMQAEYDAKARQWEELQAKKRELEAEERARRVAAAPLMGPVGGGGGGAGGSGGGGGGGSNVVEWSPLMGSGPVGGFKSNRCTRRGG